MLFSLRPVAHRAALIAVGLALGCSAAAAAPLCFPASGKAGDDAQTLRLQADTLGWTVGVPASITAGAAIKAKVALYPKGQVTICLADQPAGLAFRVQASTGDDKDAGWRNLPGKRKPA